MNHLSFVCSPHICATLQHQLSRYCHHHRFRHHHLHTVTINCMPVTINCMPIPVAYDDHAYTCVRTPVSIAQAYPCPGLSSAEDAKLLCNQPIRLSSARHRWKPHAILALVRIHALHCTLPCPALPCPAHCHAAPLHTAAQHTIPHRTPPYTGARSSGIVCGWRCMLVSTSVTLVLVPFFVIAFMFQALSPEPRAPSTEP